MKHLTLWKLFTIIIKNKGIISILAIKYIDIMEKDIYIEYSNNTFEYISFTKAKKLILKKLPTKINYSCADKEKSSNFLNTLLNKYKIIDNILILK